MENLLKLEYKAKRHQIKDKEPRYWVDVDYDYLADYKHPEMMYCQVYIIDSKGKGDFEKECICTLTDKYAFLYAEFLGTLNQSYLEKLFNKRNNFRLMANKRYLKELYKERPHRIA